MHRASVDVDTRNWKEFWHLFEYYDDYPEPAESLSEIASVLNSKTDNGAINNYVMKCTEQS